MVSERRLSRLIRKGPPSGRGEWALAAVQVDLLVSVLGTLVPVGIWNELAPDRTVTVPVWLWAVYAMVPSAAVLVAVTDDARPYELRFFVGITALMLLVGPGQYARTAPEYLIVVGFAACGLVAALVMPKGKREREIGYRRPRAGRRK